MDDLISRAEAISAINGWDWQDLYLPIHFKQVLEELPTVENVPQWIPCSERIPTPNGYYLITVKSETGLTDSIMAMRSYNGWDIDAWHEFIHDDDDTEEVTAWMPLPEPYEVEKRTR